MEKKKFFGILMLAAFGFLSTVKSTSGPLPDPIIPIRPGECICTHLYAPVCIIETGQQYSNSCFARCAGYGPEDWYDCFIQ